MFVIVLIAFSCKKNEGIASSNNLSSNESGDVLKENVATWVCSGEGNSKSWFFKIVIKVGHSAADCGNKCVKIFGEQGHINCRGFGNVCNKTFDAIYSIGSNGEDLTLILKDPDVFGEDLDFDLPDRTLFITNPLNNNELWLNIPEQLLKRDSIGIPFAIHNIWFSENPELENK